MTAVTPCCEGSQREIADSPAAKRIGRYEFDVSFAAPPNADRADTLAAWLLARWEADYKEGKHADARVAC